MFQLPKLSLRCIVNLRKIAPHIHRCLAVTEEAVVRSHQALVRRCSPQVVRMSHMRVVRCLVVSLVEPQLLEPL